MKKVLFLIFASLLVLTACGQEEEKKEKDNKTETTKKDEKKETQKRIKLKKTQIIMTNKAMNSKIIK